MWRSLGCYLRIWGTHWYTPTDLWRITREVLLSSDSTDTTETFTMVYPPILQLKSLAELPPVHVHISNLAAQTGASLFLQTRSAPYYLSLPSPPPGLDWTYNKTEGLTTHSPSQFTHLVAEASGPVPWGWKKVECIEGFDGWSLNPGVLLGPARNVNTVDWGILLRTSRQILTRKMRDQLCILEKS